MMENNFQGRDFRNSKNYGSNMSGPHFPAMDDIPEDGSLRLSHNNLVSQNGIARRSALMDQSKNVYDTPVISRNRTPSEDDLKWKLRYAHLYTEINWMNEIKYVCQATNSMKPMESTLKNLREYPIDIQEKLRLSRKLRRELGDSQLRTGSLRRGSVATKQLSQKIKRKTTNSLGFSRSGFSPFALWGDTLGRIAAYFGSNVASYFSFLRFLVIINIVMCVLMFGFVSLPQIITGDVYSNIVESGFFGELTKTIFFYGAYSNDSIGSSNTVLEYKRPLAYLITWSCANFLAVIIIVISMYINYRRIKGYNLGDSEPYSTQLFTSWDYTVTSRKGTEKMKGFIINYFRETKKEESFQKSLTYKQRMNLWIIRIVCNLVSIGALGGSAYLIYFVAENTIKIGTDVPQVISDFFRKYQLTLLVSGLKVVVPPLLSLLLLFERYHPRTEIKIKISRTVIFYVASLVVFLASVYSLSNKCMSDSTKHDNVTYCCWENQVGEQLFQMVILDLILCVLVGLVITGGQSLLYKFGLLRKFGKPDFDVAGLILDLVYGQALIWLGLYAAPFFAMVALVKLVIIFYFNYGLARIFCEPNNVFRASRSGTFYLFVLVATQFVCLFPMTYAIVNLDPSDSCGPFRNNSRVYEVLTDEIGDGPEWLQDIIHFASTSAVIIPLIIILILLTIYYKARSETLHNETKELRHHLEFERKVEKRKIYATAKLVQGISVPNGLDELGRTRSTEALYRPGPYVKPEDRPIQDRPIQDRPIQDRPIQERPVQDHTVLVSDNSEEPTADYEQVHSTRTGYSPNRDQGQAHPPGVHQDFPPRDGLGHPFHRDQEPPQGGHPGYQSNYGQHGPAQDSPFHRMSSARSGNVHPLESARLGNHPSGFSRDDRRLMDPRDPIRLSRHGEPSGGHHNPVFYGEPDDDFQLSSFPFNIKSTTVTEYLLHMPSIYYFVFGCIVINYLLYILLQYP
ncbi:hypothetical protein Btru_030338 [Bulinus truncatus]|nr:hypothetical protein Btru_030338 [Bulinus truncatus]